MGAGYIESVANSKLDADVAAYPWVQLHTGSPGAAGTSNVAGNTTRKDLTSSFAPATGGVATSDVQADWTDTEVSTSETYTHCSFWSASGGGSCGRTGVLTANAVNATGDTFSILAGGIVLSLSVAS